jgi:prefoldin beta subunit
MIEIESALNELKNSEENYKIIGNIMVKTNKEELQKDLNQKRELFELRIKTIEKQEKETKEKASKIQTEVMKEIEGN